MRFNISVIIPIYNTSSTIEKCAKSLFNQTMRENVEFLFIDDCSTDNSVEILRNLLCTYPQLKDQTRILHNVRNLGVTETRKRGLEEANGVYVAWVDSDDWVETDMLEKMWQATNNGTIDIVVQNVTKEIYDNGIIKERKEWKLYSSTNPRQALANYYTDKYVPWGLPFQMSRRSLILSASQRIHNVSILEDSMMLIYLFSVANSCVWLEKSFYHYVNMGNNTSLIHSNHQTKEEWNKQVLNIDEVAKYLLQIDRKKYAKTVNYIKWLWKNNFSLAFDSSWAFWNKYRECYKDIVLFDKSSKKTHIHRLKIWLTWNIYPIYWLKVGRYKFSK